MPVPNVMVYDCEIATCIPSSNEPRDSKYRYNAGWHDFAGMGVACVCAWDATSDLPHVFLADNFDAFQHMVARANLVIGYNSIRFDNPLVKACLNVEIPESASYDLLREVWAAAGLGPEFDRRTHTGYTLGQLAVANDLPNKTGAGADAPKWFQDGHVGRVVDYCLHDVALTLRLVQRLIQHGTLKDPKTRRDLTVRPPHPLA